jgi:hypothetical protein
MSVDSIERRLDGYALFEMPHEELARRLADELDWVMVERTSSHERALPYLSEFTWPATRHVVFPGHRGWSAMLDNTPNADVDRVPFMANRLQTRAIRVVNSPERRWKKEGLPDYLLTWESRIVQFSDRSVEIEKSIVLNAAVGETSEFDVHDEGSGAPVLQHFVDTTQKRTRERFTTNQLAALVNAFGTDILTEHDLVQCDDFVLLNDPTTSWAASKGTPAERDNPAWYYFQMGVAWSNRAQKSANWYDSVIQYLEKAVTFDPTYEAQARSYLSKAYVARKKREGR